jgi:hypothetical protein
MLMKKLYIGGSILIPYLLVAAVAVARLTFTHPYNLIPIFSALLFFGACRPVREFGIAVLGLIGLDIFITTHHYGYRLAADQALTWMWYLVAVVLGALALSEKISMRRIVGSSLFASISFFVVSNFSVWFEWNMYPKTLSGLAACYVAAIPFFRNSVVAELVCSVLLFSLARYSQSLIAGARLERAPS